MKKLFCLFIFGVIGLSVFYLSVHQKHPAHARVAPIQQDSFKPCFAAMFDSQSGVHRAGTGLGPAPRSDQDYHSIPIKDFNLPNQESRARGSSHTDQQSADTDAGGTVTSEDVPGARSRSTEVNPQPITRAVSLKRTIWRKADTVTPETGNTLILRARFLDGSPDEIARVKRVAPEWSKHANVQFEFVPSEPADIRIGFDPTDGHWSYPGTAAKNSDKPMRKTMNLALRGERYRDAVILHEFGHALGLMHEHQHPEHSIQWNEPEVIRDFMASQNWTEQKIRYQVINRLGASYTNFTAFDRHSIMLYATPNHWTIGDFETPYNETLSATDKQFIGKLYPKRVSPPAPSSTKPGAHIARVWADHNVQQNSRKGMRIHVQFEVDNFKSKPGIVVGFFYFRSGKVLKDFNGKYRTQSGTIAVAGNFRPGYRNTIYSDYTLFIPYQELHLKSGKKHNLKCVVALGLGNKLGASSEFFFYVNTK